MKKLIIVGTGPFGEVAKAYFEEYTDYRVAAFACHARLKDRDEAFGCPLCSIEELPNLFSVDEHEVFIAIGLRDMNRIRQSVYNEVKEMGFRCASFIHPDVKIWSSTTFGDNVFIFEDNTIQPFTTIGCDTILWSGNHIGHHSTIGNHCFLTSHIVVSGLCMIGDNVFIGVNASLHDSIKIGNGCLIGAGAIISRNIKDGQAFIPESTKRFPGGVSSLTGASE